MQPPPFPATVLRSPSPTATCTCEHWALCDCTCHGRACDPIEQACDVTWLADDGGLVFGGCPGCTPGDGAPHYLGCDLIGWNVPVRRSDTIPEADTRPTPDRR